MTDLATVTAQLAEYDEARRVATEQAAEAGIASGRCYYLRRPHQRSGLVFEVETIHSFNPETGFVILFGRRIRVQSRKFRSSATATSRDVYWGEQHKVFSFKIKDATQTGVVQGVPIPGVAEIIDIERSGETAWDPDEGGNFVAFCSRHETFVQTETKDQAIGALETITDFCVMCQEGMD